MSLKERITEDMKTAMRAAQKARLGTVRMILAGIKQREVDERIELDDVQVLATLEKMLKQRRDSVSQFDAAQREDLSAIERAEMVVIETYLPTKLNESPRAATAAFRAAPLRKSIPAVPASAMRGRPDGQRCGCCPC